MLTILLRSLQGETVEMNAHNICEASRYRKPLSGDRLEGPANFPLCNRSERSLSQSLADR